MRKVFARVAFAALMLAGTLALSACGGPKVFNYGNSPANITVDEA